MKNLFVVAVLAGLFSVSQAAFVPTSAAFKPSSIEQETAAAAASSKRWTTTTRSPFRTTFPLWATATTNDATDTKPSTPSSTDVVLFGVGDLRTADHGGLFAALTAATASSTTSKILPVCLITDAQLANLSGSTAHTVDTARLVAAAVQDLSETLQRDFGLSLQVELTGTKSLASSLQALLPPSSDIVRVHVADLGDADNSMAYGSYGALLQEEEKDNALLPVSMTLRPWSTALREQPWQAVKTMPDQFPEYQALYKSATPRAPFTMPVGDYSERSASTTATTTLPLPLTFANDIQARIMETLQLESARCAAEHNTGLFATHWGGLDPASVSSTAVHAALQTFCTECGENDKLWSQHPSYVTRTATRNSRSLEHAATAWQLAGDGTSAVTGHTENWLAGESMTRYLAAPLFLGTISPTQVWHAAAAAADSSNSNAGGPLLFFQAPLKTLVEGQEWHRLLAAKNMQTNPEYQGVGETTYQYWKWHGFLCRYAITDFGKKNTADEHEEGVLLIHGFGASGSQWNKAMGELSLISESATQGLAPDLIGFGQAEKPAVSYTSYMWDSYSIDFGKEVAVNKHGWKSYVVGGNSIGGFTSICVAASDTAAIESSSVSSSGAPGSGRCTGLVLMNSAGPVKTREEIEASNAGADEPQELQSVAQTTSLGALPVCKPLARGLARTFGNGLLLYLRPNIQSICKNLYPTNPAAVDDLLCEGILRDSLDPGAINVMISGAKLPPPRTVNELLGADFGGVDTKEGAMFEESTFDGPVLIATGVLDPLNDAQDRTERFGALRQGISVDAIQAGHCPHDELPGDVAASISKWMTATRVERLARVSSKVMAVN